MSKPARTLRQELSLVQEPADPVLDALDRQLLNDFQHDFPLSPRPFAEIGERLGVDESEVIERFHSLRRRELITRVGPVFCAHRVGASTLVAMAVPQRCLHSVANLVNQYPEVNHNYEREHEFNLWFVLTACDEERITEILEQLRTFTGFEVLHLPLLEPFHIDLGFSLW